LIRKLRKNIPLH
jgi:hypothetical protein